MAARRSRRAGESGHDQRAPGRAPRNQRPRRGAVPALYPPRHRGRPAGPGSARLLSERSRCSADVRQRPRRPGERRGRESRRPGSAAPVCRAGGKAVSRLAAHGGAEGGCAMRRILFGTILALLGVTAVHAQTVKIGFISTFSGPDAAFGEKMTRGINLYTKLNQHTLPPGVKVDIVTRDDGGPVPDRAKALAQELVVRDKVHFLTGVVWTPNAMAMAPIATEAKVPFMNMNASASVIVTRSPYIARFSFTMG